MTDCSLRTHITLDCTVSCVWHSRGGYYFFYLVIYKKGVYCDLRRGEKLENLRRGISWVILRLGEGTLFPIMYSEPLLSRFI